MPYRLKGILKSPNGQPLTGVDLQFIAQQTLTPVLQQTDHNIRLGLDGSYDVSLEFNTYAVKAQIGGLGQQHMGYIRVDADTPAGLDLPQLLRSYSQEATAPDYAKMIEEWLKEAKAAADKATAEAVAAKAQADRAKSEADRASEISGLNTVADAIGLAAVPFPDVWIPFNDSLRMIAGFGRDVKVGTDVVATYANYERATTATYIDKSSVQRTAAINEPRFEKQGLLREGQSTNLCIYSHPALAPSSSAEGRFYFPGSDRISITEVSETLPAGIVGKCSHVTGITNGYLRIQMSSAKTVSVRMKSLTGKVRVQGTASSGYTSNHCTIETDGSISSITGKMKASIVGGVCNGWVRYSFYDPDATTSIELNTNALGVASFKITDGQLEASELASSYIPTAGTAVTRAADKITIPRLNNDCVEWYSGADKITPTLTADTIEFLPPTGRRHIRNLKGFFTPLTEAQKKGLK